MQIIIQLILLIWLQNNNSKLIEILNVFAMELK